MKKRFGLFSLVFSLVFIFNQVTANDDWPILKGPYLGQKLPGDKPEIFAPGLVSTERHEHSAIIFSPDMTELYFSDYTFSFPVIIQIRRIQNQWKAPEILHFTGNYGGDNPVLTLDGKCLYFRSKRPTRKSETVEEEYHSWYVEKTDKGWGEPKRFNFDPYSFSKDGTMYCQLRKKTGKKDYDLYRIELTNGEYSEPISLGPEINSDSHDLHPYVEPDGKYMVFSSNRPGSHYNMELYISFRKKNGKWTEAKGLGTKIKPGNIQRFPRISPDGKYLFYNDQLKPFDKYKEKPLTYSELKRIFCSHLNGNGNIYWISTKIIEYFKPNK